MLGSRIGAWTVGASVVGVYSGACAGGDVSYRVVIFEDDVDPLTDFEPFVVFACFANILTGLPVVRDGL